MTITEIMERAHDTATKKGWHDAVTQRDFDGVIALMHSELSEALEDWRNGSPMDWSYAADGSGKPVGIGSELADVIIRVCDTCQHEGIDLEAVIEAKMAYNKTRPYRHGGKRG